MSFEIYLFLRGIGTHRIWRHFRDDSNDRFTRPRSSKLIFSDNWFPDYNSTTHSRENVHLSSTMYGGRTLRADAPVASAFTTESMGASVVGVRVSAEASPEEISGETDDRQSESEVGDDWRSAMERGDSMKLKRRTSSTVGARTRRESQTIDTRGAVKSGEGSHAAR